MSKISTERMKDSDSIKRLRDQIQRKMVAQYDSGGDLIAVFDGIHEAERCAGVSASNILLCCRGKENLPKDRQFRL